MMLSKAKEILSAEVSAYEEGLDQEIKSACGSDLMSDVLAFSREKVLLLTGLVNPQVIRTAEMMDIKAVVFLRGKTPSPEILRLAEEKEIVVMSTGLSMYVACGRLYNNGLGEGDD